jgi:hypothetical protein
VIFGKPQTFTREHYEAHRGVAPAALCELVVHCLELVSQLAERGLEYRFKGGNSLLLLLEDPQRFSIDVDIVTTEPKERITQLVGEVAADCELFTRWESRQPKTKPWLPLISYKIYFDSGYAQPDDAYVMLDAVLEPPAYPGVLRPVRCGTLYESAARVEVPSVSGLIGDKLLAIGPSTLGIPIGKGKEAQRLKHVFDVALLSRQGYDRSTVRAAVDACQAQEQRIQGRSFAWAEIVADTVRFCSAALGTTDPPPPDSVCDDPYRYEIAKGFDAFRKHLFREDYGWVRLQEDCRAVVAIAETL